MGILDCSTKKEDHQFTDVENFENSLGIYYFTLENIK